MFHIHQVHNRPSCKGWKAEENLGLLNTYMIEHFAEIVSEYKLLTIFQKCSTMNTLQDAKYASVKYKLKFENLYTISKSEGHF